MTAMNNNLNCHQKAQKAQTDFCLGFLLCFLCLFVANPVLLAVNFLSPCSEN